jgi:hypothetical protein
MNRNAVRWLNALIPCLVVFGLPAFAAQPTITYFDAEPSVLAPAVTGCTFDVLATPLNSNQKLMTFLDQNGDVRVSLITGGNTYLFTNLSTGKSQRLNLSGPGKVLVEPGDSLHVLAKGSNVLIVAPGAAPGFPRLALTRGPLDLVFSPDFMVLSINNSKGTVEDVCTLLN